MILAITFSRPFIIMYNNLVSALNNIEFIISINCLYGNFIIDLYLMESYIVRISNVIYSTCIIAYKTICNE